MLCFLGYGACGAASLRLRTGQSLIYIAILQGEGTTCYDAPHMLHLVTCSVGSTFIQGNLPNVSFHTRWGRFWGKIFFLSLIIEL